MKSARLLVVRGPETGLRYPLDTGRALLGSDSSADIRLLGLGIAGRHCEIHGLAGAFAIRVLDPDAPCYLNRISVRDTALRDGDRLRLGDVDLLFRDEESASPSDGRSLIAACSLFYLFRAMHGLELADQAAIEGQIREFAFADLGEGALDIFVGGDDSDWAAILAARNRESPRPWAEVLAEAKGLGVFTGGAILLQVIQLGANTRACIAWHSPGAIHAERAIGALAAIASVSLEAAADLANLEIRTHLAEERVAGRTGILGQSPATLALAGKLRFPRFPSQHPRSKTRRDTRRLEDCRR